MTDVLRQVPSFQYDQFIDSVSKRDFLAKLRKELGCDSKEASAVVRAFGIRYYPHEVMTPPLLPMDREIIGQASELVSKLETANSSLTGAEITTFQNYLNNWLSKDKVRIIIPFVQKLNQLRRLRNQVDIERPYYITELKFLVDSSLLQLIGQINHLGGEDALSTIDETYLQTPPDPAFTQEIRDASRQAFWDGYREKLPSHLPIIPLLVDFLHRHRRLLPNRSDLQFEVQEYIDIELIKQWLETQVVTTARVQSYLRYILNVVKTLVAPVKVQDIEFSLNIFLEPNLEVFTAVNGFFTSLFPKLDKLEEIVAQAKLSMS